MSALLSHSFSSLAHAHASSGYETHPLIICCHIHHILAVFFHVIHMSLRPVLFACFHPPIIFQPHLQICQQRNPANINSAHAPRTTLICHGQIHTRSTIARIRLSRCPGLLIYRYPILSYYIHTFQVHRLCKDTPLPFSLLSGNHLLVNVLR